MIKAKSPRMCENKKKLEQTQTNNSNISSELHEHHQRST